MIPEITHQQFAVLDILAQGETSGQKLRDELEKRGEKRSGPAFYQFMSRLEEAGFVEGWYEQRVVDGQPIKERRYRLLGKGESTRQATLDFYLNSAPQGGFA